LAQKKKELENTGNVASGKISLAEIAELDAEIAKLEEQRK
jgi:hypothetical protein